MEGPATPRDRWDKVDLLFKALGSILTPLAIASLGYFGNQFLQSNQAREARDRLQTELMSKREESESSLRKDTFKSIIESFFAPGPSSLSDRMLQLEILTYNFYESFNLKPLFSHFNQNLDDRIKALDTKDRRAPQSPLDPQPSLGDESRSTLEGYRTRLNDLAGFIADKQRAMLEQVGSKFDMTLELKKLGVGIPVYEGDLKLQTAERARHFRVEALEADVPKRRIRVAVLVQLPTHESSQRHEFWVEPFDFPIIDNIRLSNDERLAVVLTSFEAAEGIANLTAVYFPGAYASLKEKPYLDEAIRRLTRENTGSPASAGSWEWAWPW